jgi:hypothetical protein
LDVYWKSDELHIFPMGGRQFPSAWDCFQEPP